MQPDRAEPAQLIHVHLIPFLKHRLNGLTNVLRRSAELATVFSRW